jgi:hypothetical protein
LEYYLDPSNHDHIAVGGDDGVGNVDVLLTTIMVDVLEVSATMECSCLMTTM